MKSLRLRTLALLLTTGFLFTSCSEDAPTDPNNGPPDASIVYTAVRQTESGQYQLGVDFDVQGGSFVSIQIDGENVAADQLSAFTVNPSGRYETFLNIDDPGTASHTVQITVEADGGSMGHSADVAFSKHQKAILVEIATSANCLPCAGSNEHYHQETGGEVAALRYVTVKYHVWWPRPTDSLYILTKDQGVPRVKYYLPTNQDWIAPVAFINGPRVQGNASKWFAQAAIEFGHSAGAVIELDKTDNGNTVDITAKVTGISSGSSGDLRLYTVVTESDIHYNDGNPEYIHHNVMKRMLPDWEGEAVSIPDGQTQTFNKTITVQVGEKKENMEVIVFLQRAGTYEILQAAKIAL